MERRRAAASPPARGRPAPGTYCDTVLLDVGCKHCSTNSMLNYFKAHPDIGINLKKPLKLAHQPFTRKNKYEALYRTSGAASGRGRPRAER